VRVTRAYDGDQSITNIDFSMLSLYKKRFFKCFENIVRYHDLKAGWIFIAIVLKMSMRNKIPIWDVAYALYFHLSFL